MEGVNVNETAYRFEFLITEGLQSVVISPVWYELAPSTPASFS